MIQGWKCEYCHDFNVDKDKMSGHEVVCSFNPRNKYCWTCDYYYDVGYNGECIPSCVALFDIYNNEGGGCIGWHNSNVKLMRKAKLEDLSKSSIVIDESLDFYNDKNLFPEKLEKANEMLKNIGLPKSD